MPPGTLRASTIVLGGWSHRRRPGRHVPPRGRRCAKIDPGHHDIAAELLRLLQAHGTRQPVAGHARRQAEVVSIPRRRAGLSAGASSRLMNRLESFEVDNMRRQAQQGRPPTITVPDSAASALGAASAAELRHRRSQGVRRPSRRRHGARGSSSAARGAAPLDAGCRSIGGDPPERDLVCDRATVAAQRRTDPQRVPEQYRTGGGGSAAMPCKPRSAPAPTNPALTSHGRAR